MTRNAALGPLATTLLAASVSAQDAPGSGLDPARQRTDFVLVKFDDGIRIRRAPDGALASPDHALVRARAALHGRVIEPHFANLRDALTTLRDRVRRALPAGAPMPADLRQYFRVPTRGANDVVALLADLRDAPGVATAYAPARRAPSPGDLAPVTPSLVGQQSWRGVAPTGVDAFALQQVTGGMGRGARVVDIEVSWRLDHEDCATLRPGALIGPPPAAAVGEDHGTAVGGILAADNDEFGVSGLVPDANLGLVTALPGGYSVAGAIVTALAAMSAQDVLLIEAQTNTPLGFGPVEWEQAEFDAIQNATALGVIVVEPAGNGGFDLGDPQLGGRFDPSIRDSGAILVGSTNAGSSTRAPTSCHGARVDTNGWGLSVVTTGYGDLLLAGNDPRQAYTATFGGTSAASAMVAGVATGLVAAARAQLPPAVAATLDPRAMRTALRSWGTPLSPGQAIGLRPDAAQLLAALRLQRGLRLLQPPVLGQTVTVEITPPFAATAADAWVLAGAALPANLPLPLGNPDPLCNRLLLDPTSLAALLSGPFVAAPIALPLRVPNVAALRYARYYLQAVALDGGAGHACASSSVQLRLQP